MKRDCSKNNYIYIYIYIYIILTQVYYLLNCVISIIQYILKITNIYRTHYQKLLEILSFINSTNWVQKNGYSFLVFDN
jgi:hypothetical protein